MRKRATGILLFCVFLLAAIVAGYVDMMNSESERLAQLGVAAPGAASGAAATPPAPPATAADAQSPAAPAAPSSAPSAASPSAPAEIAAVEPPPSRPEPDTPTAAPETAAGTEPAAPAASAVEPAPPGFDVLRAEPGGALVVAGRGPPGGTVRLLDGTREIARETIGADGTFAMVPVDPLAAGPHQLFLEAETEGGARIASRQTAVVDVPPPGQEDQLLAMIEEEGAPTRIVERPKPAAEAPAGSPADAPAAEAGGTDAARTAESRETQLPAAPSSVASAEQPAADLGAPTDPASAAEASAPRVVMVEAVEIENGRVFVAGTATPGLSVRVYLDDALVGESAVSGEGRFLVSAARAVPVGPHTVRADQIARDGTVAFRAEVPFSRPDEGAMSAVAANEPGTVSGEAPPEETVAMAEPPAPPLPSREAPAAADASATPRPREAQTPEEAVAPSLGNDAAASPEASEPAAADAGAPPAASSNLARAGTTELAASAQAGDATAPPEATAPAPSLAEPTPVPSGADIGAAPPSSASADGAPADRPAEDAVTEARPETPGDGLRGDEPSAQAAGSEPSASERAASAADRPATPGRVAPESGAAPDGGDRAARSAEGDAPASPEPAASARASADPAPADAPVPSFTTPEAPAAAAPAPADEPVRTAQPEAPVPAPGEDAAERPAEAPPAAAPAGIATARQAPLQAVEGRVIIRRGDNLWRISREVYGAGRRYTVIYLANGDQIRDPDRIYPGQVFRLPDAPEPAAPAVDG